MSSYNPNNDPILDVRGLSKEFPCGTFFSSKQVHAVEDVSFFCQARPGGGASR